MTITVSINPNAIFYLPAWVVHPTLIDQDNVLSHRKPAEQAGGAKGRRPAQAGRAGILKQRDLFERSEIEVRCSRCEAPKPIISKNTDNDGNNDLKWDDNLTDGTEDTNHNGRIDGDNGDGIKTSNEAWDETSPTLSDSDNDGFRDDLEWENDMDPRTQDSDHDGLLDQEEDVNLDFILDAGETDPSLFDTDGDGLSDKTEIDGWSISIIIEATGEEQTHYTVSSDPRKVHSDTDTLTDYQEFQNCTDPTKDDTDGDGKDDYEELTYDFGSSPTGIDGRPPTITDFDSSYALRTEAGGPWHDIKITTEYVVKVYISAEDIFGIDWVNVHLHGIDNFIEYFDGEQSIERKKFEFTLDMAQAAKSLFSEIEVNITAMDINNNLGYKEDEIPSLSEQLFEGLLGDLNNFAQLVSELFSSIYDWIVEAAKSTFNNIIEPVLKMIYEFINGIYQSFDNFVLTVDRSVKGEAKEDDSILISFFEFILSIFSPFINIFQSVIDIALSVISFLEDFKDMVYDLVKSGITEIMNLLLGFLKAGEVPEILPSFVLAILTGTTVDFISQELIPLVLNPVFDYIGGFVGNNIYPFLENSKMSHTGEEGGTGPRSTPIIDTIKEILDFLCETVIDIAPTILKIIEVFIEVISIAMSAKAFKFLLKSTPKQVAESNSYVNLFGDKLSTSEPVREIQF